MSYFLCRVGLGLNKQQELETLLMNLAPVIGETRELRIEGEDVAFYSVGPKKAISDIVVRDAESGSWVVVLGTPLLKWRSEDEKKAFLEEVFRNPTNVLRRKIGGNFALIGYDGREGKTIIATDFNSTVPVFYVQKEGAFLFSSHELPLARVIHAEFDPFGFSQAIHLGATWEASSRFVEIRKLLSCQLLFVDNLGTVRAEDYWSPADESVFPGSLQETMDRWLPIFSQSVGDYYECSGRRPLISDFTGGEDGRLIVAQCHALGIPYKAHVTGTATEVDVKIAQEAAQTAGFDLLVREKCQVGEEQLLKECVKICLQSDGYQEFAKSCTEFATDIAAPLDDFNTVKYCGLPGGEAFRGSYYLRGKAFFPESKGQLDHRFFTKMKYLLDYQPGLLNFPDDEFLDRIYGIVERQQKVVTAFPVGTQVDHLLRMFQTCLLGLKYKGPIYLPLATANLTRSIYWLSPKYKSGGRLTKACTEQLFPKLAFVKTQNGVPTIKRTLARTPLFIPEYVSLVTKVAKGVFGRWLKWTPSSKWYHSKQWTGSVFTTLLKNGPYSKWFSSPETMATGHLYQGGALFKILERARSGENINVSLLSRIISAEVAYRWTSRLEN